MHTTSPSRKPYPTDVSDDEWAFVAPYLTLLSEDALQRCYPLREVFNALRWLVRAGAPWRLLPTNFPPWPTVYQQTRRWVDAGCFEALVHDLRLLLRLALGTALGGDLRRPHVAIEPRKWGTGRLRRPQAGQGVQGASGCGYAGHSAGAGGHARQRRRAYPGGGTGGPSASGDRRVRGAGLGGPGLHGRRAGRGRRRPRHPVGSRAADRGQARLCASAASLGGGKDPVTRPTIRS